MTAQQQPTPTAVRARGLSLHGKRGVVYGPVDLDIEAGELAVVHGPQGGGRSSLLLTLAGRMKPDAGADLLVLGEPLPRCRRAVQRRAAIAGFAGIDDLDESVTVGVLVRERLAWLAPWYRRVPRVTQATFERLVGPVYGPRPVPRVDSVVWDLDEVDVMLLRLALATLQAPELVVVDDVDQVHDSVRRQLVWSRLEALTGAGTTVVASVASLDEVRRFTWTRAPRQVFLATGPHATAELAAPDSVSAATPAHAR
ncbi:AAA family ATPase [Isoptericola sp. b441]|uniref:AAA family ATPase n=1 Tax=Actinotalea lenta TaxID=3064654 RepID=A0ABT9D4Q9_9CELL|nr:ATP-binding cassette domain-containing protein [Isoptericola sp. b441]MDO8105682.1 AAA family ATPase [Isoptericola sp. b441]